LTEESPHRHHLIKNKWIRGTLVTLLTLVGVSVGLIIITWTNRSTIINLLQEWYHANNTGQLAIGEVTSNFSDFPKIGFTIYDIHHVGFDPVTDKSVTIRIQETDIVVRVFDLLMGDLNITKVFLRDAELISEVNPTRPFSYYIQLKMEKNTLESDPFQMPAFLDESGAEFQVENSRILLKDTTLNKYFDIDIDHFSGEYTAENDLILGEASMDVLVHALGFNMDKGAFLKNTRVIGKPSFTLNTSIQVIESDTFTLSLNNQQFETAAAFTLTGNSGFEFYIHNEQTDLSGLRDLLSDSVAAKIRDYQLLNPMRTEGIIRGQFGYGNFPLVMVDFSTVNNRMTIADRFILDSTAFSGHLTTDIYAADSIPMKPRSREDVRITLEHVSGTMDGMVVRIDTSYIQSSPDALNFLNASVEMQGSNEALGRLVNTRNFQFEGGRFDFKASITGDIPDPSQILNHANGTFSLENTRVILRHNKLGLPVKKLALKLDGNVAELQHLEIILPGNDNIIFTGQLTHPADLLSDDSLSRVYSIAEITADHIDVDEILAISTELLPPSRPGYANQQTLHQTLGILYQRFHPGLRVDVKSLSYKGITLNNVRANLSIVQPEVVSISTFEFAYNASTTTMRGKVTVPTPRESVYQPVKVDIQASSRGQMTALRDLFNIERMEIVSGEFDFEGGINARVKHFRNLLYHISGDLILRNNTYYYEPADIHIQLDSLKLDIDQANLYLEDFAFDVGTVKKISMQGNVSHFPDFLLDVKETPGSIELQVHFPSLNADTISDMISELSTTERENTVQEKKKLFTLFKDLNHFDPVIEIRIDSLSYQDLTTHDISSRFTFQNDSVFSIEQFDIRFNESMAQIQGSVMALEGQQTITNTDPFKIDFSMNARGPNTDLNDLLNSSRFLFQSGKYEFSGRYEGASESLAMVENNLSASLRIGASSVYSTTADLLIPIDRLEVEINNNLATLTYLGIDLPGKSSVDFSGNINNVSSFIRGDSGRHSSAFFIESPYLDIKDLISFLSSSDLPGEDSSAFSDDLVKVGETLDDIGYSFNPTLTMEFDSLKYNDQLVKDFHMIFSFDNNGQLIGEELDMEIFDGHAALDFRIGTGADNFYPVEINMNLDQINLNQMIVDLDYFGNAGFREADRIEGRADLDISATGRFDDQGKLIPQSLNGTIAVDLQDLKLYDYQPLLEKIVLFRKERFEKLQFQPIVLTLEIIEGEIVIPRTEIQSSGLQFFLEGRVKLEDFVNVWISVPWNNLKQNDGQTLPAKTTYEFAGAKLFVQLVQDLDHPKKRGREMQINIRLSNRELRKGQDGQ
jgi:hypothetical protein